MSEDHSAYKHDASDKKLNKSADAADAAETAKGSHAHAGHTDEAKTRKHDDAGKDRLFEGRIQRDDADKESDRNHLEKDIAKHHHGDEVAHTISDTDNHPKKKK